LLNVINNDEENDEVEQQILSKDSLSKQVAIKQSSPTS